jgi:hypothetical protein
LETIIVEQQNMIETTGFYIQTKEERAKAKTTAEKLNKKQVIDAYADDSIPKKLKQSFT